MTEKRDDDEHDLVDALGVIDSPEDGEGCKQDRDGAA